MKRHPMRYRAMIGVGGIGSGSFFKINGNHTLGREESRSGFFLDQQDYCKLHIISHYVKELAEPGFEVIPIGRLGNDEVGRRLYEEMKAVGFDMSYTELLSNAQTMFSFCFLYPDGSGGNLTTADSACSKVNPDTIQQAEGSFKKYRGEGIAVAAPEVSIEARLKLLEMASNYKFYRAASFTSAEIPVVLRGNYLHRIDLLAINMDEASALTNLSSDGSNASAIVEAVVRICSVQNPNIQISVTDGKNGSWCWDGKSMEHFPTLNVQVSSTAGAGDAHLAGLLTGLAKGFSLHEAHEAAVFIAGLSVMSPHTINKQIKRKQLKDFTDKINNPFNGKISKLIEDLL